MRCWNTLKSLLLSLGILTHLFGEAQVTDSLKHRLAALEVGRQAGLLKDTDYLRSVDSIAPLLEGDDSLPELQIGRAHV